MLSVIMIGLAMGNMIFINIVPSEAPSIRADSIKSSGIETKKVLNMKIPVAVLIEGIMIPAKLSYKPNLRITVNTGFMITSVGNIVVAIIQTKKNFNHFMSYFANAKPHVALAITVNIVVITDDFMVFVKYFTKSRLVHASR